jgi:putative DeoR family transcriptional regulator (stage III sporulation protein D)
VEERTYKRSLQVGRYIIETGSTIRETAAVFGLSKTTIQVDVSLRLPINDAKLFDDTRKVLERNRAEASSRGAIRYHERMGHTRREPKN